MRTVTVVLLAVLAVSPSKGLPAAETSPPRLDKADRIKPCAKDPRYWQYRGEPVLLLGGTKDDSLFQIPDLKEHLDLLASVGGNYVRNTMSARADKGFEIQAFRRLPNGKYDLDGWNDEYWARFENLLRWTSERDVVVQIEVWDRFDYTDARGVDLWQASPYRPANNVNYTGDETGLADRYPDHPWRDKQPFFHTIPGMKEYQKKYDVVRRCQERFVAKMLSHSLPYGNVLYCMNNETSTSPKWGQYWMAFIGKAAAERGVDAYATDMFDDGWKPEQSEKIRLALDHPEIYPFIEISQVNSRNFGEDHWNRLQWVIREVQRHPRPVNNTKIYGAGKTTWGSGEPKDGVERFWRDVIGGCASARFHRDGGGTGLQPISQASLKAARKLESLIKLWDVEPQNGLLSDREENEAYLAARPGEAYALYFTDGGSVGLDVAGVGGELRLKWINVATGDWAGNETLRPGSVATVRAPAAGGWVAAITRE
ncbi:MAG: hypothetical protein ACYTG0_31490 [Planctomycetota bacterium]|jgi:hypothetical protein